MESGRQLARLLPPGGEDPDGGEGGPAMEDELQLWHFFLEDLGAAGQLTEWGGVDKCCRLLASRPPAVRCEFCSNGRGRWRGGGGGGAGVLH
jgi:hypothetical protein